MRPLVSSISGEHSLREEVEDADSRRSFSQPHSIHSISFLFYGRKME